MKILEYNNLYGQRLRITIVRNLGRNLKVQRIHSSRIKETNREQDEQSKKVIANAMDLWKHKKILDRVGSTLHREYNGQELNPLQMQPTPH